MTGSRVTYPTHPAAPWPGTGALAAIYGRAIERFEEARKGGPATAHDDAIKESSEGGGFEK
jgi:hypothetical protein